MKTQILGALALAGCIVTGLGGFKYGQFKSPYHDLNEGNLTVLRGLGYMIGKQPGECGEKPTADHPSLVVDDEKHQKYAVSVCHIKLVEPAKKS